MVASPFERPERSYWSYTDETSQQGVRARRDAETRGILRFVWGGCGVIAVKFTHRGKKQESGA